MDSISATPRNKLLGLLADGVEGLNEFTSKPFGYDNPPGRMLSQLIGLPAVANTVNELSYGGALGTGSGMTWKPKADTLDAAMTLAPLAMATPGLINRGAAAVGRRLEAPVSALVDRTMARGGLGADLLQGMAHGTKSQVYFVAPNKTDPKHLATVKKEMETMGAPTIRAYWDGEKYVGLEGSHRAQAAKDLGITPNIEEMSLKQWMVDHDFPELRQKASTNRILDYLEYGNHPGSKYIDFEDL